MSAPRCAGEKPGTRCLPPVPGSMWCRAHDPSPEAVAARRDRASRAARSSHAKHSEAIARRLAKLEEQGEQGAEVAGALLRPTLKGRARRRRLREYLITAKVLGALDASDCEFIRKVIRDEADEAGPKAPRAAELPAFHVLDVTAPPGVKHASHPAVNGETS